MRARLLLPGARLGHEKGAGAYYVSRESQMIRCGHKVSKLFPDIDASWIEFGDRLWGRYGNCCESNRVAQMNRRGQVCLVWHWQVT